MKERKRMFLFVVFSASAALVQFGVFALLFEIGELKYWPSYVVSIVCLIFWNTFWNRKYTFQSSIKFRVIVMKLMLFYVFFIPTFTFLGDYFTSIGYNEYLVLSATMIINMGLAYYYNKFLIYRKEQMEAL